MSNDRKCEFGGAQECSDDLRLTPGPFWKPNVPELRDMWEEGLICKRCYTMIMDSKKDPPFHKLKKAPPAPEVDGRIKVLDRALDACVTGQEVLAYLDANGYSVVKK